MQYTKLALAMTQEQQSHQGDQLMFRLYHVRGGPQNTTHETTPLAVQRDALANLAAEIREHEALIREGRIVHNVPVKHVEFGVSHGVLGKQREETVHQTRPKGYVS